MKLLLLAAAGGALGATGRYLAGHLAVMIFGIGFPWGTLIVNVAGSFAMGVLIGWLASGAAMLFGLYGEPLRIFLAIGVLGGFTTFSAFSLDAVALYERGDLLHAAGYVFASVFFSIAGLAAGLMLMRQVTA